VSPEPPRVRHELACIDVSSMRGLEIGPLHAPRVRKEEGEVLYVDHTDAAGLRSKYVDNPVLKDILDQIVEIDYVMKGELCDTVADGAPFDYVMASHLIEHIPDPIAWLMDIAHVLRPGGILALIIPDKRFTFDINRRTTQISDLVDAYLRKLRIPSFRQAYDFISHEVTDEIVPAAIWAGAVDFAGVVRRDRDPDVAALELCRTIARTDEYVDVHCSVFTPASFLDLYEKLVRIGLIEFEIAHFVPTAFNDLEFHVSLRRTDPSLDRDAIVARQLASIPHVPPSAEGQPAVSVKEPSPGTSPHLAEVSAREWAMLSAKRHLLERVRRLLH
jgi:SAM-dependent methyltransferase